MKRQCHRLTASVSSVNYSLPSPPSSLLFFKLFSWFCNFGRATYSFVENYLEELQNQNPSSFLMESQLPSPEQANPSIGKTSSQLRLRTKSSGTSSSKKRAKKLYPSVIRRSERIQNAVLPYQDREMEPVVQEMTVSESEKDDEPPAQGRKDLDEPALGEQNLQGKIDYVVKLLETQERTIKALKTKNDENPLLSESLSPADVRYKRLYVESQKKVQALMDENHQLTQKLETALCKVEAYEKGNRNFTEVLEKMKDVILVSNLTKVTETAVNASSQAIRDAMSPSIGRQAKPSAAKRKKMTKQSDMS